jgi:hypothetical protein
MKKKINYLGFLSLLSLISILGYFTDNAGLYGFLGFLYYLRYFAVIPDELFKLNVRKAATAAWLSELILFVPLIYTSYFIFDPSKALRIAFGLSFAFAIFIFTIVMLISEYRENAGIDDD